MGLLGNIIEKAKMETENQNLEITDKCDKSQDKHRRSSVNILLNTFRTKLALFVALFYASSCASITTTYKENWETESTQSYLTKIEPVKDAKVNITISFQSENLNIKATSIPARSILYNREHQRLIKYEINEGSQHMNEQLYGGGLFIALGLAAGPIGDALNSGSEEDEKMANIFKYGGYTVAGIASVAFIHGLYTAIRTKDRREPTEMTRSIDQVFSSENIEKPLGDKEVTLKINDKKSFNIGRTDFEGRLVVDITEILPRSSIEELATSKNDVVFIEIAGQSVKISEPNKKFAEIKRVYEEHEEKEKLACENSLSAEEKKAYQEYDKIYIGDRIDHIGDKKVIKGLEFITDYPNSCVTEQVRKETAENIEKYWDAIVIPTNPDIVKHCEQKGSYRSGDILLANHVEERTLDGYNDSLNRMWFAVTLDGKCSVYNQYEYYFYYKGKQESPSIKKEPSFTVVEQLPKKGFMRKFNPFKAMEDWVLKPAVKFFIKGSIARKNELGGWGPFIMETISNARSDRSSGSQIIDKDKSMEEQQRKIIGQQGCIKQCEEQFKWCFECRRGKDPGYQYAFCGKGDKNRQCEKQRNECIDRCR